MDTARTLLLRETIQRKRPFGVGLLDHLRRESPLALYCAQGLHVVC
jgi:hypothetical protein